MFPLWDVAIAPVLRAAQVTRVVEIGALRGETTVKMLHDLGADAELHVIDPVPEFDPREHEREFPGRYYFHEALSLDVLPDLEPMDAALIDGDHNWYTVYNELRLLAEGARRGGAPLPVMVMHDVLWPYGRRDLYYSPDQIPDEFRQPYAQKGMRPGGKRLIERGGLNPTMYNAELEGGPRNGVMTALDDFVAEHDKPLRVVVLPIYFGLAIVVEEERLARQPQLAAELDRLEGAEGRSALLDVAETVRLRAMIFQHNVFYQRAAELERATARYLRVVKAALLNEHYLDHEVRIEKLAAAVTNRQPLVAVELRDPVRHDQAAYRRVERNRLGPAGPDDAAAVSFLPYAAMGRAQLDHLERCLDTIRTDSVPGDLVECGTGRGGGAIFMRAYLDAHEIAERRVWVADRFRSSPEPDLAPKLTRAGVAAFQADLNLVRDGFERFELLDDRVRFVQGTPADTLAREDTGEVALLRIGRTTGTATRALLDEMYGRLAVGGFVIADAPEGSEARAQLDGFRADAKIESPLEGVDVAAVTWRKTEDAPAPQGTARAAGGTHPPLAPPAPEGVIDLTVVVVIYNMRREAERTLQALSRAYQEDVAGIDYEVIVVENGSDADQLLGADFVARFGSEFRYVDLAGEAEPSPVGALNRGIRAGRGRNFALMIDGAHVVTPGVVRFGLAGLATYAPAIVATQQWYVGPGQQGEAMDSGYDQAYEDRLFDSIDWPHAGYRLFEIGHFVGDRDWLDGLWESNCMFVGRELLEQVGCFDDRFSVAGGGYANLELYERLGSAPNVRVATIIGEGSFHQVHGGTTTNQTDAAERRDRVFGYSQHYADLRGRAFKGPGKQIHYVGRMSSEAARRSKSRRMSTRAFADAAAGMRDGLPDTPTPVPDELKWAFTEAVWRNLPWTGTTWLGRMIATPPTDLIAYQEILWRVRPDWVIEIGTGDGARALFLASMCELLGHGTVLSIDAAPPPADVMHPRLQFHCGVAQETATLDAVRALTGDPGAAHALVVLGATADRATTFAQFEAYSPFVPVGSYVVVADTIVNGHPVWPAFGAGPAEAVKQLLARHGEFVADPLLEKYSLTFNPGGFLRRVR
jgi:cephalosporin hydroxylase